MASNVGSAFLAIFPVFNGFRKAVDKEIQGATGSAGKTFNQGFTKAGASAGQGFTQGFTTNSKDVGIASLKTLEAQVRSTTQANSRARLAEQDAIGKVNIAQAAYNATIGKYAAGSVQSVKATENLASAQRKAVAAGETAKGTFSAMTLAQGNLKKATEDSSNTVQKQSSVFSGLGSRLGSSISDGFGGAMKTVVGLVGSGITAVTGLAAAGATAVGVTIGAALTAGFSRLTTIETAQAKLKALGNTSQDIAEIMKNANDSVIGTQYSLADAVTAAAAATAAGIKPGQDLYKYLKLQGNAAAVAGVDFGDLGLVMNQVQSQNKAYTQDLNQVASRGIPIYQSLAKVYGTTQAGLRDLLQQGGVDAAHFRAALELNVGNAADEIGKTTVGSFENMKAAFTRFGAALLAPAFPAFAKVFNSVRDALDKTAKVLQPLIEKYAPKIASAFQPFVDTIGPAVSQLISDITDAANSPEGQKWFADMGKALKDIGGSLKDAMPSLLLFLETTGKLTAAGLLLAAQMAPSWIHGAAQISDAFSSVSANIATALSKISDGTFWDTVLAEFGNGATQIQAFLTPPEGGWLKGFENGGEQISVWWSQLLAAAGNGWTQLTGMFANGWVQITSAFANGWGQITAGFSNGWLQITGAFANGAAQIGAFAAGLWANVTGAFANGWAQITTGVSTAWANITGAFSRGAGQIGNFFATMQSRIVGAIGNAGSWLINTGRDVVQGFINGIAQLAPTIGRAFLNLVPEFIRGPFEAALGINSPSKVFFDNGVYTGQGYIDGIKSITGGVKNAVTAMVSVPTTSAPSSSASGSGAGYGNVYVDKIVAPDQNPVVSGRIMSREFLRNMAGVAA